MIAARCVGAAGLLFAASRWLGPGLGTSETWPLVAAVAASFAFLLPGRPRTGETPFDAGSRAGLAALAVWLPWALAVDAPPARLLAPGALLCASAGLAAAGGRTAGALLVVLVAGAGLLGAGGQLTPDAEEGGPGEAGARGAWRVVEVPLELSGPLERATLGHEGYPALEVRADLLAGERAAATAWVVEPVSSEIVDAGSPELLGPTRPEGGAVRAAARRLPEAPLAWARRPLPAPDAPGDLPLSPAAALLAVTAALVAGLLAAARRLGGAAAPASLIALAACAAIGVRALAGTSEVTGRAVVVLEGRAGAAGDLEWAVSARIPAPLVEDAGARPARPGAAILLADPSGPLGTELVLSGGKAERRVLTRSARVGVDRATAALDLGLRLLRPEVNTLVPLEEVWTREGPGEDWAAAGSWPVGSSLPEAGGLPADGSVGPPDWARSGLPMGEPLLLGRVAQGAPLASRLLAEVGLEAPSAGEGGRDPGSEASFWVRVVGFGR